MARVQIPTLQNLFTRSESLTTTPPWTISACTNSAETDPNGGSTATKILADGTTSVHQYFSNIVSSQADMARVFCRSLYLKAVAGQTNWVALGVNNGAAYIYYDPVNGVFGTNSNSTIIIDKGAVSVGNGWYRVWVVYVVIQLGTSDRTYLAQSGNNSAISGWAGTGQGVITWGQQLVQANWPGPYQVTTAAAVNTGNIRNLASGRVGA